MKTEIVDIEEIKELIFSYASGDYKKRAIISDKKDERDTILGAINMLGEELEETTVSRDYFSSIYNAVAEMLFLLTPDGTITEHNDAISRELGYDNDELKGLDFLAILNHNTKMMELMKKTEDGHYHSEEMVFITRNGKTLPVSVTVSHIPDDLENRLLVIAKNITEQKKTEQVILRTIIDTEEKERKRLAVDLHDSLGQEINAVKMYLNVAGYGNIDTKTKENIEQCKLMLENSIDSIRKIVFDLLPSSLDKGNLDLAVNQLIDSLAEVNTVKFDYILTGEARSIEKRIEIMVYRIIQEFLNNSLKHADANLISVCLDFSHDTLSLYLEDDGEGFDPTSIKGTGNGLKNMTSRVKAVDGELAFDSIIDKGTRLSAKFKIDTSEEN